MNWTITQQVASVSGEWFSDNSVQGAYWSNFESWEIEGGSSLCNDRKCVHWIQVPLEIRDIRWTSNDSKGAVDEGHPVWLSRQASGLGRSMDAIIEAFAEQISDLNAFESKLLLVESASRSNSDSAVVPGPVGAGWASSGGVARS